MSNDTIYRQAAIDAMIEWYGCKPNDIEAFEEIIKAMPSAQPECADCIKNGGDWECDHVHCHKGGIADNRLEKIADIVEGTIDHLDRDDAMDMLYQIKEVLK